jgi:hypothetical protein
MFAAQRWSLVGLDDGVPYQALSQSCTQRTQMSVYVYHTSSCEQQSESCMRMIMMLTGINMVQWDLVVHKADQLQSLKAVAWVEL